MDEEAVLNANDVQVEPEKTLPVSRVNEIVKREKGIAAENVRKELEARHAEELARFKGQSQHTYSDDTSSMEDRIVQRLMDEARRQDEAESKRYQEEEANKFVQKYSSKMSQGKEFFNDFEEVMGDFVPQAFPQIVYLATQEENTPAIMYELAKNPSKLAAMHTLAMTHPALAEKEMRKLSQSISANQQALQQNVAVEPPLSRLKSSQNNGVDMGKMSIADFKNAEWLRPSR